jgi:hypothetical protein
MVFRAMSVSVIPLISLEIARACLLLRRQLSFLFISLFDGREALALTREQRFIVVIINSGSHASHDEFHEQNAPSKARPFGAKAGMS